MPVIRDFGPDLILVSAGFNSTSGHPSTLGGYSVTPKCEFIMRNYCSWYNKLQFLNQMTNIFFSRLCSSDTYANEMW